jgi:hypothetical protein
MKTFKEFLGEARDYTRTRSREDALKILQSKENPDAYRLKNRQTSEMPYWGLESREKQRGQQQRRSVSLRALNKGEVEDFCKRNLLHPDCNKMAGRAIELERVRKRKQKEEVKSKTQETSQEHNIGHITPQPDKRSPATRKRFQAVHPGDASYNRQVELGRENREKGSKNVERTKLTRSSAVRSAFQSALDAEKNKIKA